MPIHRGQRLNDYISRLPYVAAPIGTQQWYKTWPNLATGLTVTAAASPGGAWVEFIAAASAPTTPFTVTIHRTPNWGSEMAFEVGTGAAGSETPVAAGMSGPGGGAGQVFPFPIIPGGTRVALRGIGPGATQANIKLVSCLLPTRLDILNTLRMTRKLSSFYPGLTTLIAPQITFNPQSVWTYTAYTQLFAATVEPNPVILTGIYQTSNAACQVAYATGAAGSEVVFAELPSNDQTGSVREGIDYLLPVPLLVPGGTRFAAKVAVDLANATVYYPGFGAVRAIYQP